MSKLALCVAEGSVGSTPASDLSQSAPPPPGEASNAPSSLHPEQADVAIARGLMPPPGVSRSEQSSQSTARQSGAAPRSVDGAKSNRSNSRNAFMALVSARREVPNGPTATGSPTPRKDPLDGRSSGRRDSASAQTVARIPTRTRAYGWGDPNAATPMMAWPPGGRHPQTPNVSQPITPSTPTVRPAGTEEEEEHFFEPEGDLPGEEGPESPAGEGPWALLRRLVPGWGSKYYDARDAGPEVCVCHISVCHMHFCGQVSILDFSHTWPSRWQYLHVRGQAAWPHVFSSYL